MSYFVYILFSESLQKYYTGHSIDLSIRLIQHNSGEGNFTSKGVPWKLVWSQSCKTRSEAMKLKNKIKKRGANVSFKINLVNAEVSRGAFRAKVVSAPT